MNINYSPVKTYNEKILIDVSPDETPIYQHKNKEELKMYVKDFQPWDCKEEMIITESNLEAERINEVIENNKELKLAYDCARKEHQEIVSRQQEALNQKTKSEKKRICAEFAPKLAASSQKISNIRSLARQLKEEN
jgi:hypothetical protein